MTSPTTPEERLLNPFSWYRYMRENKPIYRNEEYYAWNVFRYKDVQNVLSNYEAFSSQMMGESGDQPLNASIINLDPPRHRKLRSIATQAFTPRTIAKLAPRITAIVHELLDKVAAKGQMDIIDDLAYPLPVIVIAEMLGVPVEYRKQFKLWSDMVVGSVPSDGRSPQQEMSIYFARLLEERRHEPKDDLLTALLNAQVDGEHLTEEELYGFCILLLIAGNVTTTNLIGNAFVSFSEFPEALEQLYADPLLLPGAIEEVLRYRSPVRFMYRVSKESAVLGDQHIGPGQFVVAWIGSANHDEIEFPNPDVFNVKRNPNKHIAFGHGIHYCLGAPLARLEAKIALEAMLERLPQMQMAPNTKLEPVSDDILHGVRHFPITFKKS